MVRYAQIFMLIMPFLSHAVTDKYLEYLKNPLVRGFLDTIAYAEGTLREDGYKVLFGYFMLPSFKDHPCIVICKMYNDKNLCSTAAGRYQFLCRTWDALVEHIHAEDFSPLNQDCAALYLIEDAGALDLVLNGQFEDALDKIKNVWASLPRSELNQRTKSLEELRKIYKARINYHKVYPFVYKGITKGGSQ